jgi:hypothetical protein
MKGKSEGKHIEAELQVVFVKRGATYLSLLK